MKSLVYFLSSFLLSIVFNLKTLSIHGFIERSDQPKYWLLVLIMICVFWIGATIVSLVLNLPTYWSVSSMRERLGEQLRNLPGVDIILHFIAFFSLLFVSVFPFLLLYAAVIFVYSQSSAERVVLFEHHMQTYGIRYATIFMAYGLTVYMRENWSLLYHSVGRRHKLAFIYDRPMMRVVSKLDFEQPPLLPHPLKIKNKAPLKAYNTGENVKQTQLNDEWPDGVDMESIDVYLLADWLEKRGEFISQINMKRLRFVDIVAVYTTAETRRVILRNGTTWDCPTIFDQLWNIGMDSWIVMISKNYAVNMFFAQYPINRVTDDLFLQPFIEYLVLENLSREELNEMLRTGKGLRGYHVKQFLDNHQDYSRRGWDAIIQI